MLKICEDFEHVVSDGVHCSGDELPRVRTREIWKFLHDTVLLNNASVGSCLYFEEEFDHNFAMTEPDVASSDATNISIHAIVMRVHQST